MSKIRDIELESAYWANKITKGNIFKEDDGVNLSDSFFASQVLIDHGDAIVIEYERGLKNA